MKTSVIALGGISIIITAILAAVAVFGIQSVAADATSTVPVDAEPIEQPMDSSSGSAAATTSESTAPAAGTIEETTAATTTEPIAETTSTSTPSTPPPSEVPEVTDAPAPAAIAADVSALQENYYQETGSYLQILRGNGLPTYETGTVAQKLGKNVAEDVWVHVYEAPTGKGYQVFYEEDGVLHSVGYGPEAAERTFTRTMVAAPSATSSPSTISL